MPKLLKCPPLTVKPGPRNTRHGGDTNALRLVHGLSGFRHMIHGGRVWVFLTWSGRSHDGLLTSRVSTCVSAWQRGLCVVYSA